MANSEGEVFAEIEDANKRAGEFLSIIEQELHDGAHAEFKVDTFANFYKDVFERSIETDETDLQLTEYGVQLYTDFCHRLGEIFKKEYGIEVNETEFHPATISDYYTLYRVLYLNNVKFFLDIGIGKLLTEYDRYYQQSAFFNDKLNDFRQMKVDDDQIKFKMISLYKEKSLGDEEIAHKIVGLTLYDENYLDLDNIVTLLNRAESGNLDYIEIFGEEGSISERYCIDFYTFKEKLIKDYLIEDDRGSLKRNIVTYFKKYLDNLKDIIDNKR